MKVKFTATHRQNIFIPAFITLLLSMVFCPGWILQASAKNGTKDAEIEKTDEGGWFYNRRNDTSHTRYYLFSYFLDQKQGMCYAISTDGLHWKPLNSGHPYLTPKVGKQKLMRDPSIHLGPDSLYRVVWTTDWKGSSIGYAYSNDLIHWSKEELLPVMKNVPGTKMCWAPEIFYDDLQKEYMIFWSSSVDSLWSIYYTLTNDFIHFTSPKILFTNGFSGGGKSGDKGPIDAFIYKDSTNRYVLFYKKDDNTGIPNLYYKYGKTPQGSWGKEIGPIIPSTGDEGPSVIKINGKYHVYTDPFESDKAYVYISKDLVHWQREKTHLKMSHGTVLEIPYEAAATIEK